MLNQYKPLTLHNNAVLQEVINKLKSILHLSSTCSPSRVIKKSLLPLRVATLQQPTDNKATNLETLEPVELLDKDEPIKDSDQLMQPIKHAQ